MAAYRVMLWGYGGDGAYLKLTKEQYDYWRPKYDEEGDDPLLEYMLADQGHDDNEDAYKDVPPEADFMLWEADGEESYRCPWYEAPTEFCHQWGVSYDTNVNVCAVESTAYNAQSIGDPVIDKKMSELQQEYDEIMEFGVALDWQGNIIELPEYWLQFWSAEKGTFFEGYFETDEPFDAEKLKFYSQEFFNGDDTIVRVEYDGVEVNNEGGDTNGKGYSVSMFSQRG